MIKTILFASLLLTAGTSIAHMGELSLASGDMSRISFGVAGFLVNHAEMRKHTDKSQKELLWLRAIHNPELKKDSWREIENSAVKTAMASVMGSPSIELVPTASLPTMPKMGFKNLGNTCFANAALKLFLTLPRDLGLFDFLQNPQGDLEQAAKKLIQADTETEKETLISTILNQVSSEAYPYNDRTQHDSVGFLQSLIEKLNPDFSLFKKVDHIMEIGTENNWVRHDSKEEGVTIASLVIPELDTNKAITLQKVVDQTFDPELLTGNDQIEREHGGGKCDGEKRVFWESNNTKSPATLMLHLNRGSANNSKSTKRVTFDNNLQVFGTGNTGVYRVKAAIIHYGETIHAGHYIAYIKENGRWYRHDDNAVFLVDEKAAIADIEKNAVLLHLTEVAARLKMD